MWQYLYVLSRAQAKLRYTKQAWHHQQIRGLCLWNESIVFWKGMTQHAFICALLVIEVAI